MKISQHPQGSPEWLNERKGIPTASEFAAFMVTATTATAKEARAKYLAGKLTDAMDNDEFEQAAEDKAEKYLEYDPWIQRGKVLEPVARKRLSKLIDREIVETGLVFHDIFEIAGSPDGLVVGIDGNEWEAGCEIKCHNRKRHLADLLAGGLPKDHAHQVHGMMVVTGLRKWHYFGFHPALPSLHVVVEWSDFTDSLSIGLQELVSEKAAMKRKLAALWTAEFQPKGVAS